ncbi:MAG: tetratricopeptide repeat protein [Acidobacteria bacterium]|nr:tetratricopeptide repeat protein [Acidobacteriota bacterium]
MLSIVFSIAGEVGYSQTASSFSLIGSVRNQSGQTVSGVRVSVIDENYQPIYTAFVDSGGRFNLKGLKQGRFVVRIETTGTPYQEYSQPLELQALRRLGGNEDVLLDIILKYKKGEGPQGKPGTVFVQDVPKAAQKEMDRSIKNLKENNSDQAINSLKKAIEIFPDYFDALEKLGLEYIKVGQYNEAISVLTRATEVNKRASRSLYALGVANLKLSRLPQAIEWLNKSEQIEPNNPNTQMMLGLAYGNSGSFDKSEAAFKKALQFGGDAAAEAHYYLTGLYNKQERYREAWQELELFLKDAKNVKDPAQIKAMIANLKEKEKIQSAPPAITSGPAAVADSAPPSATATPIETESTTTRAEVEETKPAATLAPIPPLPAEFAELIHQADANGTLLHKNLLDYTYQLKKVHRVLNERGNSIHTQEQVFEAYPIRGEHVLISISRDGVASRTAADDRKRAAKQLEEAEKLRTKEKGDGQAPEDQIVGSYVSAGITGIYAGKPGYVSINIPTFLRSCDFFSPRVEKIGDRETVILNYRYHPGVKLTPNQRYIANMVGTVWIDQEDKVLTRLEGWPASAAAFDLVQSTAPREEAALIYQQTRQGEKTWMPSLIRMNAGGRTDLFDGLNWDVVFEFSNYRQFNTQAEDAKIKAPAKTP